MTWRDAAVLAATAAGPLPRSSTSAGAGPCPVRELVRSWSDAAGFRGRIEESAAGSDRSAQVSWQCSDITAAEQALGWRPSHTLDDALSALWETAAVDAGARLLIPLYVHPAEDPGAWHRLISAATRTYGVVLNPANGPGEGPDPAFTAAADALRAAGARLLGYVDTDYGVRDLAEIAEDLRRHREWYAADGCFLDRVTATPDGLAACRRLVRTVRRLGAGTVVLNPGRPSGPGIRPTRRPDRHLRGPLVDVRLRVQPAGVDRPASARAPVPPRLRRARGPRPARRPHRARARGGSVRPGDGRTTQSLGPVDTRTHGGGAMRHKAFPAAALLIALTAMALTSCSGSTDQPVGAPGTTSAAPRTTASGLPTPDPVKPVSPSNTPSPTPPSSSATPSASASQARWKPRPGLAWQWQLDGPVEPSADVPVYDIDGFENSAADVARLHRAGRKVICYVNVGAWEDFRPDQDDFPDSVLGEPNGWAGERWLDIRRLVRAAADHGTPLRHVPRQGLRRGGARPGGGLRQRHRLPAHRAPTNSRTTA